MKEPTFQGALGFFLGVVLTVFATFVGENKDYKIHIESYQMGMKHALRTNPVSWELDEACLQIWAGKEMK